MTMTISTTKDAVVQFKEGVDSLLEKRDYFVQKILHKLVEGRDFYVIKGRKSLGKAGAEKLAAIYQLTAVFHQDRNTMDSFRDIPGLIAFTCNLTRKGEVAGQGRGVATLKANGNDPNKCVKMAQKSAYIDAVVRSAGLSDIFSQDIEDAPSETISPYQPRELPSSHIAERVAVVEEEIANEYTEEDRPAHPKFYEDEDITEKQKKFLTSLILERIDEPEERERWLQESVSLSKRDASETISHFLAMTRA